MLKKLGYKWHLLVKNPKLWIYKCKINFYKCKLTCDKKLCQVIHSRSEICWKKPKYTKKMSFWRNIFLPNLPCLSPCRERSKVERPQILFFLTLFPYFFGVGSKKNIYIYVEEHGVNRASNRPFWSKLTFLKWNFGRMRAGSPAIPGLNKLAGEVVEVTLTLSLTFKVKGNRLLKW